MSDPGKKTSIKSNFAFQAAYDILILILPFISSPYVARVIGAEGLGIYSYAQSVAYYFVMFSALGIQNYGRRLIAQNMDSRETLNQEFSSLLAVHILASSVCLAAYVIYVMMMPGEKIYAVIMGLYVLSALFDISWFYFGTERFKLSVAISTAVRIASVIAIFSFIHKAEDLWIYTLILALGFLANQLLLWVPLRRYVTVIRPDGAMMKKHLKPLMILFLPVIAVSVYRYMDKIMIGILSDTRELGFYENAEKIPNMAMTLVASFGSVALSRMSYLIAMGEQETVMRYIKLSMELVMCMALALSFGVASVATVFAPVFWGAGFSPAGPIIMGLSITMPFLAFSDILRNQFLLPRERDKEYTISLFIGAGVNVVLNLLLIGRFGAMGAVAGTIGAEASSCLAQSFMTRKELPLAKYVKSFSFFIVLGAVMFIIVRRIGLLMGERVVTLLVQVLTGAAFYGIFSLIYFIVRGNEVVMAMLEHIPLIGRR